MGLHLGQSCDENSLAESDVGMKELVVALR